MTKKKLSVGDIVNEGTRFWVIRSIVYGATHQESVVGISVADGFSNPNDDAGKAIEIMYVPARFLQFSPTFTIVLNTEE